MAEGTPTTGEVRERFIDGFPFDTWATSRDQCGREFDRWLAAHDREVAAKALREAAERELTRSRADLEAVAEEKFPSEGYVWGMRAAYIQGRLDQAEAVAQLAEAGGSGS